jgi:kumamolisin
VNVYSQLRSLPLNRRPWRRLAFLTLATAGAFSILASADAVVLAPANASGGQYIANNTPAFVASAKSLGATDPSLTITVSVWLNAHNRSELDALAKELYQPASPQYRHWLTSTEVAARFAPTAAEAQIVKEFLESKDLTVTSIGPHNFYVRATGTIAQVEKAFDVQINNYTVAGNTVRSNSADPYVDGPAAALIQAVSGLDDDAFRSPGIARSNILSGSTPSGHPRQRP